MPRGPILLAEEKGQMLRLKLAGKSYKEIARITRRHMSTVWKVLGPVKGKHERKDPAQPQQL